MRSVTIIKIENDRIEGGSYREVTSQIKDWETISEEEYEELRSCMPYLNKRYDQVFYLVEQVPTIDLQIMKAKEEYRLDKAKRGKALLKKQKKQLEHSAFV